MLTPDLIAKSKQDANRLLAETQDAYIGSVVPKLKDEQHQWIRQHIAQDPMAFDALLKRFGSASVDAYLRGTPGGQDATDIYSR